MLLACIYSIPSGGFEGSFLMCNGLCLFAATYDMNKLFLLVWKLNVLRETDSSTDQLPEIRILNSWSHCYVHDLPEEGNRVVLQLPYTTDLYCIVGLVHGNCWVNCFPSPICKVIHMVNGTIWNSNYRYIIICIERGEKSFHHCHGRESATAWMVKVFSRSCLL